MALTEPAWGHNETTARLGLLAEDARKGLGRVASGEADAIEGWLIYGAALNEGRAFFPGDAEFGQWVRSSNLEEGVHPAEQSAAMWAAANPEQFEEARAAGNARTVRGIHSKWKEIEAEREREAARIEAERARAEAEENARQEREARQREQEARTEADRREARERAEQAAAARMDAEGRAEAATHRSRSTEDMRRSVLAAVDDAQKGADRKNPLRVKDDMTDRVFKFSGLCRSLAEFSDVEQIARWDRIPQTTANLRIEVREAMHILSRFLEADEC